MILQQRSVGKFPPLPYTKINIKVRQGQLNYLIMLLFAAAFLSSGYVALLVRQVIFQYPHMDISDHPKITFVREKEPFFEDKYINPIANQSTSSLFRHPVLPPYIHNDIISKIHDVSLVISHCDHPLDWVSEFTSGFENLIKKTWIFTKCGQEIIDAPQGADIIKLPNVGRCDHTYAYWMNNYFYNRPNPIGSTHEIIVFLKDTDYLFEKKITDGRKFGDLLSLAVTNGLGCMMRIDVVTSNLHDYGMLRKMAFGDSDFRYTRSDGEDFGGEQVPFYNENFQNLGEWIDKLQLSPIALTQNIVPVCYSGVWAVTSYQIARQPQRMWKAIEESLSRGDNIAEGHYAERMWASLLSKPFSNESASAIWEMNPTVHENPYF